MEFANRNMFRGRRAFSCRATVAYQRPDMAVIVNGIFGEDNAVA
jgi:hypothetical protein